MSFTIAQFLTAFANASALFFVAVGLSIIFGVTRIVNFAHGSFYMLGAYLGVTISGLLMPLLGGLGFWLALPVAAAGAGLVGLGMERFLLRRLYRSNELFPLLATFGLLLVLQDVTLHVWGPEDIVGPRAPWLDSAITLFGNRIPEYDLFLIAAGPTGLLALWLLFKRTRWGILVRAATEDREMVAALAVDQQRLFASVVALGTALAGLGGALQLPREAASLGMDLNIIAEAFVVVVVGGMGSIFGSYLAALLIAVIQAFGILLFPEITLVIVFLVMAVILALRPQGLFGKRESAFAARVADPHTPLLAAGAAMKLGALALLFFLAILPLFSGRYVVIIGAEILIFALFAASLQFLLGLGGIISFGHAAFLGLGAYSVALLGADLGWPMEAALLVAPVVAGLVALAFGWFCARLSGVYLAMLTLAFAQILWSVAFQWYGFTGGDNGILGVWPSPWFAEPRSFYWLVLALVAAALLLMRHLAFSGYGFALRAQRDNALRAAASGLNPLRLRWQAFAVSGACAGLAGGLYALLKGSVFPDVLAIPMSVEALVMVLLGGVAFLEGPLLGAAAYLGLKTELLSYTSFWRSAIGGIILLLVLIFPQGLAGGASQLWRRKGTRT